MMAWKDEVQAIRNRFESGEAGLNGAISDIHSFLDSVAASLDANVSAASPAAESGATTEPAAKPEPVTRPRG
jgi:3-oxoacyl-ACP reductase-like protein